MGAVTENSARVNLKKGEWSSARPQLQIVDSSAVSGQKAVMRAKTVAMLKDSEEASMGAREDKARAREMKQAQGKTFYLDGDGVTWVDGDYKGEKCEEIAFASTRYFELAKGSSKLASYLAVGRQVIFISDNHAYKIVVK
jgi:hypothetical protein